MEAHNICPNNFHGWCVFYSVWCEAYSNCRKKRKHQKQQLHPSQSTLDTVQTHPPIRMTAPLGEEPLAAGGVCEGRRRIMPILRRFELPPLMGGLLSKLKIRLTHVPPFTGGFMSCHFDIAERGAAEKGIFPPWGNMQGFPLMRSMTAGGGEGAERPPWQT